MTSEVLILNKRAIVLGADSAVTTSGRDNQPRYSKSANKIFELSKNGRIAAAIYGRANIDQVPWELALKLFRMELGEATFPTVAEYSAALLHYLSGNDRLFPHALRAGFIEGQFDIAVKEIIREASENSVAITDETLPLATRTAAWNAEFNRISAILTVVSAPLTQAQLDAVLADLGPWVARAKSQIDAEPSLASVDPTELAQLGHRLRYAIPNWILGSSGLVVAGYGEEQIFPAYEQLDVFGHIGNELYYTKKRNFQVTHDGLAMIQPLAQTSMIDMFAEGFSASLEKIIDTQGKASCENLFKELSAANIVVPAQLVESISDKCHANFMTEWKRENWKQNFHPLLSVLQSLNIEEMAYLAESLLGLESLKERVTSSSESVGGPIDVAVITKAEGLVWIKRKHYFDMALNSRYSARLRQSYE